MDHWYLTAPRTATRIDEPVPTPGAGEVLVRIAHTAISPGSNVHAWRSGSYGTSPTEMREELLYMGAGTVTAVGSDVMSMAVGDRVVLSTGHQAYAVAAEAGVHRVPAGLPLREAAISYLCSWSVSALHLGRYPRRRDSRRGGPGARRRIGRARRGRHGRAGACPGR